jgi:lipopolysaccharide/colanic/teichoic acid biosynthesis glycosyltransferase
VREAAGAAAKRALDVALAGAMLLVVLPLWLVAAAAIKLEDRGPVFFVQERWGRHKRRIRVRKFRTMRAVPGAGARSRQAAEADARITRVGRWLRATALDESPQLLSIWKGEMSFVGPRVLPIDEVQRQERDGDVPDEAVPGFETRLRVRPGLTGLAQLYAPRDVPRRVKFRYDALYVRRRTFWLDVRLILLSMAVTLAAGWDRRHRRGRGRRRRGAAGHA